MIDDLESGKQNEESVGSDKNNKSTRTTMQTMHTIRAKSANLFSEEIANLETQLEEKSQELLGAKEEARHEFAENIRLNQNNNELKDKETKLIDITNQRDEQIKTLVDQLEDMTSKWKAEKKKLLLMSEEQEELHKDVKFYRDQLDQAQTYEGFALSNQDELDELKEALHRMLSQEDSYEEQIADLKEANEMLMKRINDNQTAMNTVEQNFTKRRDKMIEFFTSGNGYTRSGKPSKRHSEPSLPSNVDCSVARLKRNTHSGVVDVFGHFGGGKEKLEDLDENACDQCLTVSEESKVEMVTASTQVLPGDLEPVKPEMISCGQSIGSSMLGC